MTKLGLRPYREGDDPPGRSVPVTVVVLTRDEEPNIARCLASVAWAGQSVVIDSGSADHTVPVARRMGADVMEQAGLGSWLAGRAGLRFCFFHAWYQAAVNGLQAEAAIAATCDPVEWS